MANSKRSSKRRLYSDETLKEAVNRVVEHGEKRCKVSAESNIPVRTLAKYIKKAKMGETIESSSAVRRGTKPMFPKELEDDLVAWAIGMQRTGYPVSRKDLLLKANTMRNTIQRSSRQHSPVSTGWLQRFLNRNPILTTRSCQPISRARNEASEGCLKTFFNSVMNAVVTHKLTAEQIFNMDETAMECKGSTRRVIACKGSKNVWGKTANPSFHLTFVAAINAAGFSLPPFLIMPGQRAKRSLLDEATLPNTCFTMAKKGWINSDIFQKWVEWFAEYVPGNIPRPLLLIMDGCSSHIDDKVLKAASDNSIILLSLPPHCTHLVQPLDVAIFKSFKAALRDAVHKRMLDTGITSLSKAEAVAVGDIAWRETFIEKPQLARSGFKTTGVFPLCFPNMMMQLRKFKNGGACDTKSAPDGSWLLEVRQEIRTRVLTLPAPQQTQPRRKTVTTGGRILNRINLHTLDS